MRLFRLAKIVSVFHRYGLDEFVLTDSPNLLLRGLGKVLGSRTHDAPRGERLRRALESLGPCFVKFGLHIESFQSFLGYFSHATPNSVRVILSLGVTLSGSRLPGRRSIE